MSDKLRAAAQAVLKNAKSLFLGCVGSNHLKKDFHDDGKCPPLQRYNDALAALEAALAAQPEPTCPECKAALLYECVACSSNNYPPVAQPEQEPVAWTTMPEAEDWCFVSLSKDPTGKLEGKWFPLYTAPPRRAWVGLTDDEIEQGNKESWVTEQAWQSAVWWAEAKLREKNGG